MQALVLGTAQWGNAYGVTNSQGRLTDSAVAGIAELAMASGISYIDTAGDYGDAEVRLAPWARHFSVTTKVKGTAAISIRDQLRQSLVRLQVERVRCCLVHDWPSLSDELAIEVVAQLRGLREAGLTEAVGISGYDEADVIRAHRLFGDLDAVQIPVSVLDRRLAGSAGLVQLIDAGVEIQARSVFLQGLLVGNTDAALGSHPDVQRFHSTCAALGLFPAAAALAYIQSLEWVQQVVIGVTSSAELSKIVLARDEPMEIDLSAFSASLDQTLVDPRQWTA